MNYQPKFLSEEQADDLIKDLLNGMSNKEAEKKYGFSSISYAKFKLGLPRQINRKLEIDWSVLHTLYVEERRTIQEISDVLGCSVCAVWKHLKAQNIPRRRQGTSVNR